MKKQLTIDEEHQIRLEMLVEIDQFCRKHGLKYQLAYGTLLGAIRHNGFIPWDDDADLLMPLPDLLRLKAIFSSENLYYCDVDTWKHYQYVFSRIVHKQTYSKVGLFSKDYGVFIDVYPAIGVPSNQNERNIFCKEANAMRQRYLKMGSMVRNLSLISPLKTIPGYDSFMKKHRDFLYNSTPYETAEVFLHYCGPISDFFTFDVFEELIDIDFEGYKFLAPNRYDEILTQKYGDYMKLPPLEDRHPYHGAKIYWK